MERARDLKRVASDAFDPSLEASEATLAQRARKRAKRQRLAAAKAAATPAPAPAALAAPSSSSSAAPAADFLDALFRGLPAQRQEAQARAAAAQQQARAQQLQARAQQQALDAHVGELEASGRAANRVRAPDSPVPLRVDADGLPIFAEAVLRIGGGGGTPACPFDCQCCFG